MSKATPQMMKFLEGIQALEEARHEEHEDKPPGGMLKHFGIGSGIGGALGAAGGYALGRKVGMTHTQAITNAFHPGNLGFGALVGGGVGGAIGSARHQAHHERRVLAAANKILASKSRGVGRAPAKKSKKK
jgi:hypothetical protein